MWVALPRERRHWTPPDLRLQVVPPTCAPDILHPAGPVPTFVWVGAHRGMPGLMSTPLAKGLRTIHRRAGRGALCGPNSPAAPAWGLPRVSGCTGGGEGGRRTCVCPQVSAGAEHHDLERGVRAPRVELHDGPECGVLRGSAVGTGVGCAALCPSQYTV